MFCLFVCNLVTYFRMEARPKKPFSAKGVKKQKFSQNGSGGVLAHQNFGVYMVFFH